MSRAEFGVAPLTRLVGWINEREAVRLRKEVLRGGMATATEAERLAWGNDRPGVSWTDRWLTHDDILREYRFCNVRREDDRVTRWVRENIREPFADHPNLWIMLAIARTINWPETLQELFHEHALPDHGGWKPEDLTRALDARRARGEKVYTGAYMIRAESDPKAPWYSWTKQRYVAEVVIGKLWERRHDWQHLSGPGCDTLQGIWEYFQDPYFTGWGPFMAYQVVVDLRWTRYLRDAPDIQTWAALGPGSTRGLNRLLGRDVKAPMRQEEGCRLMVELRERLAEPGLLAPWVGGVPDLSDVQNCLCEFDKYERVRLGEGRPRARYVPGRGW